MNTRNTAIAIAIAAISGVSGFSAGWLEGMFFTMDRPEILIKNPNGDFSQIAPVASLINTNALEELSTKKLEVGALKGMVSSIDEHSEFMVDAETSGFDDETSGRYFGVGIVMEKMQDGIFVRKVYAGSPAQKAGVLAGDRIIGIDGVRLKDNDLVSASQKIKGNEGSDVSLMLFRKDSGKIENAKMARAKINMEIVSLVSGGEVPVIRVEEFTNGVSTSFAKVLADNIGDETKGIVIDLSGNPGGILKEAVAMSSLFIDLGKEIVSIKGRNHEFDEKYLSDMPKQTAEILGKKIVKTRSIPVRIVVDKWSASASEVFSGAMRDYGRAKLYGSNTFGKGTVQQIFKIDDKAYLKMTIAKYFTPKGTSVNKVGLAPDVEEKDIKKAIQSAKEDIISESKKNRG